MDLIPFVSFLSAIVEAVACILKLSSEGKQMHYSKELDDYLQGYVIGSSFLLGIASALRVRSLG